MISFDGKKVSIDKNKQKKEGVRSLKVELTEDGDIRVVEIKRFPKACSWMDKNFKK